MCMPIFYNKPCSSYNEIAANAFNAEMMLYPSYNIKIDYIFSFNQSNKLKSNNHKNLS